MTAQSSTQVIGSDEVRRTMAFMTVLDVAAGEDSLELQSDAVPRRAVTPSASEQAIVTALETSDRAIQVAHQLLVDHLGSAGEGKAGPMSLTLAGPRPVSMTTSGMLAQARGSRVHVAVAVLADPLVLVVLSRPAPRLRWSMLPAGPSVTARADALHLLRALSFGGELTLRIGRGANLPPIDLPPAQRFDFEDEWRLFEDLAAVSEWSGVPLAVPERVTAEEATRAGQAATWIRTQRVAGRIHSPVDFEVPAEVDPSQADEIRFHQDLGVELSGQDISLGTASVRLPLARVDVTGPSTARGWFSIEDVTLDLRPPPTRSQPSRRTQGARRPAAGASDPVVDRPPFAQPAKRSLATSLSERRPVARATRTAATTAALLDDLRGE